MANAKEVNGKEFIIDFMGWMEFIEECEFDTAHEEMMLLRKIADARKDEE